MPDDVRGAVRVQRYLWTRVVGGVGGGNIQLAGPATPAVLGVENPPDRTGILPVPDHVGIAARIQRYLGFLVIGSRTGGERFCWVIHPLPVFSEYQIR